MESKDDLIKAHLGAALNRNREIEFRSNFKFLQAHNGWRKGNIHVLMGTPGGGKSTVVRSLVFDLVNLNPKTRIGYWLSEESIIETKVEMFKNVSDVSKFNNIEFETEMGSKEDVVKKFRNLLEKEIDFLIIDNITTSRMYEGRMPAEQFDFAHSLKNYSYQKDIPVVVVAHTSSEISNNFGRQIRSTDIRGVKSLTNISQFFYILQSISLGESIFQFLVIDKHRGQHPKDKIFAMMYSLESKHYYQDKVVGFDDFKGIFKQRNKL